jgi:HlyD family secretion protein
MAFARKAWASSLGGESDPTRRRRWIALAAVSVAAALAIAWWMRKPPRSFVTVPVTAGDVVRSVVATGTVNPVVTVQVGTYVSGPIQSISCDYNTEVKAGQLCAKIDPRPYQEALDQAKANLATARAQLHKDQASLAYANINYERDRGLRKAGVVSQDTLDSDKSAYDQAVAQVALDEATIDQRQAALDAAQVNLDYTNIVSPVNGTVVSRNVDVGQTVAASFQTPTLFLIAKDLTKMQVDTNVSESDVGSAQVGQKARFTVEAFPRKTFEGQVVQVRRAPITVQNVVTYDVVIGVENPELLLFPGMTANARIIVAERTGVPTVPMQALRFDPAGVPATNEVPAAQRSQDHRLWVLRDGRPVAVPVELGVDDGTRVEIAGGSPALGDLVIVDETAAGKQRGGGQQARSPFRF